MSTLAFTSLPPEVQAFLKSKGLHRFKTVEVSPFYSEDVVRELPPIHNLDHTNKPAAYSYAVSPSGHSVKANYNRVMGAWPHHTEEVAESIQLPVEHGPWTIINVPRGWNGAELGVTIRHGKLDTRYQSQKSQLTGLAASMLYVYARTRGLYRQRSLEAMTSFERQSGMTWAIVRDELLENGLIVLQKGGQLRVTPRGAEVAERIPTSYDPDNWVYRRRAESTYVPPEGLFGLGELGAWKYGATLPQTVQVVEVWKKDSLIPNPDGDVAFVSVDLLVPTTRSRKTHTPILKIQGHVKPRTPIHIPGNVPSIPNRVQAVAFIELDKLNQPFRFTNFKSGSFRQYSRWYRLHTDLSTLRVEVDRLLESTPSRLDGATLGAHIATTTMGQVLVQLSPTRSEAGTETPGFDPAEPHEDSDLDGLSDYTPTPEKVHVG